MSSPFNLKNNSTLWQKGMEVRGNSLLIEEESLGGLVTYSVINQIAHLPKGGKIISKY